MFASLRRIADTLLALGVLSLSISMLSSVSVECGTGESGCVASVLTASFITPEYSLDYTQLTAESTPVAHTKTGMTLTEFNSAVQLVSAYALLVAVLILVGLECVEPRYIRRILKSRRKTS
jgi:hypothetical protein